MNNWQDTYANAALPQCARPAEEPSKPECLPDYGFNLEELLPMELIRVHTKTDDVPSATDEQLALYRAAAVEAAEQYTSLVFNGLKTMDESVERDITSRDLKRGYFTVEVTHPIVDGIVYVYGLGGSRQLRVTPGYRNVKIPVVGIVLDVSSACCRPACQGSDRANPGMRIMYKTGYANICDVPAGIRLGMLKYVAWSVTHPGDELIAVRNRAITRSSLMDGTNNTAWASGALELWRQYSPDYI